MTAPTSSSTKLGVPPKPARLAALARFLTASTWLAVALSSPAAENQLLRGHVPPVTARLRALGRLPETNRMDLAISLPLRNRPALTNLLREIYNPASPDYHHYLTPEQFAERFGPTEQDYQAVITFARAHGFTVTGLHPNRTLVDVSGPVAAVERAFHLRLQQYRHPTEARNFYAPDAEPSPDLAVAALAVNGLDNFVSPRPVSLRKGSFGRATNFTTVDATAFAAGSGPRDSFIGKDFRTAYAPDVSLTGSGQAVGLFELDGYFLPDITAYERLANLTNVPLTNVLVSGASGIPQGQNIEVALDIDMVIAMAPGLSRVIVYEGLGTLPNAILNRMATDNQARQLSSSWSFGSQVDATREQIFQQFAAQGQTMFQASGDSGAWTGAIMPPVDDPLVTVVGGTSLTTGPGGVWQSETAWIDGGGGISTSYPIPAWQQGLSMSANQGSTTMRNIPDVACLADGVIWLIANNGEQGAIGGTSAAAPLWAGFAALANQQAQISGRPPIGFINPTLSLIGQGSGYAAALHDITTGNNTNSASPGKFFAVPGYDLCTGWGTPNGAALISALVFPPDPLLITPAAGVTAFGAAGGPFSNSAASYSLTTFGPVVGWAVASPVPWFDVSPAGGTVASNLPAATVTFSLNSAASNLVAGSYAATVWFTNLNNGFAQSRQFTLAVITPPMITLPPSNQTVLPGAVATFTVGTASNALLFFQWQKNGTNLMDGGNISGSAISTLAIANVADADAGTYAVVVSNSLNSLTSTGAVLTVVSVTAPGVTLATLYNFSGGNDGGNPNGLMQTADGSLFGTTQGGGANASGTIFKMAPGGVPSVLYSFTGENDGGHPQDALAQGVDGTFYGTTFDGGVFDNGTVFSVTSNGFLNTLAQFNITNGDLPYSGLIRGLDGNFYGTTYQGGASGRGSVYRMTAGGQLTTIYSFTGGNDGGFVYAGLTQGGDGSLYGTTYKGGTRFVGTLFKLTTNGQLSTLYTFDATNGGFPYAGVTLDERGSLLGVTAFGGSGSWGVIFRLSPAGGFTNLYAFTGGGDGSQPAGGLIQGGDGNFYGTTAYGGTYGDGTVFRISPDGAFTNLLQFDGYNGANPYSTLVQGTDGNLYGTTLYGGTGGAGTVFRLSTSGAVRITTQPAAQTVFSGASAVFSVVALGAQPMTFQWAKNGTNLSDGGNISGSGTRVLTISNVTPADAATYTVRVNNAVGTPALSDGAALNVTVSPPIITKQPASLQLSPGTTATFAVTVIGSQPLNYQWQFQPTNPNTGGGLVNVTNGGNISGATTGTLTIANALEANNGIYSVLVSNPVNSVTSASASLTVVPVSAPGTRLATLHSFMGGNDGSKPSALTLGSDGNIYGTTEFGGVHHAGSVFMVTPGGLVTNLVSFGATNGFGPCGGVTQGPDGNFYGTTRFGGTNDTGSVFMMTPPVTNHFLNPDNSPGFSISSTVTNLYSFTGGPDGNTPIAPLMLGTDGNLYGTTQLGGDNGVGNVFRISTNGALTNIYSFTGGADGNLPTNALMQGSDGNIYGVTENGGTSRLGSVFRLTTAGAFSTVYSFAGGTDGKIPNGPLVQGPDGSLYGTTQHSRIASFEFYGVIFKITTNGSPSTLYLLNTFDGHYPAAGVILGSDGLLYGTTEFGGINNDNGAVFYLTTNGTTATLVNFDGIDVGAHPETPLVQGTDGALYGTTSAGGQYGHGSVFRLDVSMHPVLLNPAVTNGGFSFKWTALPNRKYQVQLNTNLVPGGWFNSGGVFPATGATVTVTNSTGTNNHSFYRVQVVP